MTTNHFNQLTEAQAERLTLLAEECAEVVQACCKILRHGYESYNPNEKNSRSNRRHLENELAQVLWAIMALDHEAEIDYAYILGLSAMVYPEKKAYLHHQ